MAAKKSNWKWLTQQEFNAIKALQAAGVSAGQASKVMGRGSATTHYIYEADTFEGYKEATRERTKKLAEATWKKDEPTEQPQLEMVTESNTLERIATALERLVDAWEAAPQRKRLF